MQSICTLLPAEYAQRVVDARAMLAEEPSVGAIYDPPFAHFTMQLAEEYDWDGLAPALAAFVASEKPFEVSTIGLWVGGDGSYADAAVIPDGAAAFRDFHERLWEVITPYAQGKVIPFYEPGTCFPHCTIKRCGSDHDAFGRVMSKLSAVNFRWTFTIDNVSAQHDPGKNSRTHYLRHRFPFGGTPSAPLRAGDTNATIVDVSTANASDGVPQTTATVDLDAGGQLTHTWTAPDLVRLLADLQCSDVHFPGARCRVSGEAVVAVQPNTPHVLVR